MSVAALIRDMIAEGATPQLILLAVEAVEARDNAAAAERAKAADRKRRQRERDAGVTVTGQSQDIPDSTPFPAPPNENNLTPPTHTPVYISRARKDSDFPMLDCADAGLWADFLKNRKAKNLPCTATAHKKLRTDLARWSQEIGWPPGEVLTACVGKGWGAIYDPRDKENGNNGRNSNNSSRNGKPVDGFTAALRHVANGPTDEPFGNDGRGMHRTA